MKRKIEITLNGFHGYQSRTVVADIQKNPEYTGDRELDYYSGACEYIAEIAESAAEKLKCRMRDCTCGEGIGTTIQLTQQELIAKSVVIPGNYAQR